SDLWLHLADDDGLSAHIFKCKYMRYRLPLRDFAEIMGFFVKFEFRFTVLLCESSGANESNQSNTYCSNFFHHCFPFSFCSSMGYCCNCDKQIYYFKMKQSKNVPKTVMSTGFGA